PGSSSLGRPAGRERAAVADRTAPAAAARCRGGADGGGGGPARGGRAGEGEGPTAPGEPRPITMPAETAAAGPALFAPPAPSAPPSGSHLGMPIRVPQANMAPQLRAQRDADPQEPQDPQDLQDDEPWFGARSPEATRSMLTMMQQGWRRGRMDDLDDPEGVPGTGTD